MDFASASQPLQGDSTPEPEPESESESGDDTFMAEFHDDTDNYPATGDESFGLEGCTLERKTHEYKWDCDLGSVSATYDEGDLVKDPVAYATEHVGDDVATVEIRMLPDGVVAAIAVDKTDPTDIWTHVAKYENRAGGVVYECLEVYANKPSFEAPEISRCAGYIKHASLAISEALAAKALVFDPAAPPYDQIPERLDDCMLDGEPGEWWAWECGALSLERVEDFNGEWRDVESSGRELIMKRPAAKDRALAEHPDVAFQSSGDEDKKTFWGRLSQPYLSPGRRNAPQGFVVCDWLADAQVTQADPMIAACLVVMAEARALKLP